MGGKCMLLTTQSGSTATPAWQPQLPAVQPLM